MSRSEPRQEWEGRPVAAWQERWALPALQVFDDVASTNDTLRLAALAAAPAGSVVIAEYQSRGRGRLGRSWEASPGRALLLSALLRPAPGGTAEAAAVLPLRVGLAIAEAVRALTGAAPGVKWPNDVQLGGRKVAGVLCEAAPGFVVVGLGVNVAQTEAELPPALRSQATSLRLATGVIPPRPALAGAILERLRPLFHAPHRPLDPAELARFAALDVLAGRNVTIDDAPAGVARGVAPHGALIVEARGEQRLVHAGTVRSAS